MNESMQQPSQVRAMIPLTSGYKILPDSDFSKSRFSFMAKHARNKTVHFSAETQLAMVSWINVMVRAGQQSKCIISSLINRDDIDTLNLLQKHVQDPYPSSQSKTTTVSLVSLFPKTRKRAPLVLIG